MNSSPTSWSIRDRVLAVLRGQRPDRHPFIDRMEPWYLSRTRAGALPPEFQGKSLTEVHRALGFGQQRFLPPYNLRLRGVEMMAVFNGEPFRRETDPVLDWFPDVFPIFPPDRPGVLECEFITPVGRVSLRHTLTEEMFAAGSRPYFESHPIRETADYKTVEYVLERLEYVPMYERHRAIEAATGDIGFVMPIAERSPFQFALIDYLGEGNVFYALADEPERMVRLLAKLDEWMTNVFNRLAEFDAPYVELVDNLDGTMTSPLLFQQHVIPYYQRYADILHAQGKKLGCHADGNLRPILHLLPESGLDVCESFSPHPLTPCTFDEAWQAWKNGPLIWGGIPSPILEERTSEEDFRNHIARLLETIGDRPIILGIGDLVLENNLIERVRYIAEQVEAHPPGS